MKNKIKQTALLLAAVITLAGCIKEDDKKYNGNPVAEIDAAVLNSNFAGVTYPIISRYPRPGVPINTTNSSTACALPQADSTIRRFGTARTVDIRVNLIGAQTGQARTVGFKLLTNSPITTFDFPATVSSITTSAATCGTATVFPAQLPAASAQSLSITNAVPGTDFVALPGFVTIPANSSFGVISIQLINNGAFSGQGRFIGIQLDSSGTVLPSVNYRTLGLVLDKR